MDLDSKILRVHQVAKELNDHKTVPSYHQQNLEDRLVVVWGESKRQTRTKEGRRTRSEYEATYRRNLCRRKYLEVYDKNTHLFLTFILALSPRACSDFTAIDDLLQRDEVQRCRLDLSPETKGLFEGIAIRRGFDDNPKYAAFIESLFPKGDTDYDLVQRIISERGHAENPKCIEFLKILFPEGGPQKTAQVELPADGLRTEEQATIAPTAQAQAAQVEQNGFVYSKGPASHVLQVGPTLSEAVQNSMQWKLERSRGELTTECLTIIAPNNPYEDMIIQLVVAQEHAFSMTAVIDVNIVFGDSKYIYLNAGANCITILGDLPLRAAQSSYLWKTASYIGGLAIDIPYSLSEDARITIVIGQETGFEVIEAFCLQPIW